MAQEIQNEKLEIRNNTELGKISKPKVFNLEERTYCFAKSCRDFVKRLPKSLANLEYSKQLIRSSGSQAANYIEANESISKKDFAYRIKISRKEAKESALWIKLCEDDARIDLKNSLIQEAGELQKIFGAIWVKSK